MDVKIREGIGRVNILTIYLTQLLKQFFSNRSLDGFMYETCQNCANVKTTLELIAVSGHVALSIGGENSFNLKKLV